MWCLESYVSVGEVRFGMSGEQLVAAVGQPARVFKNRRGEPDYQYQGYSVRLHATERTVVEVGILPAIPLEVQNVRVFSAPTALKELIEIDGEPLEFMGFVVLLNIGITMTGFTDGDESQKAVTAFVRGRWDHLRQRMQPYVLRPAKA